jgi:hypothetical protein
MGLLFAFAIMGLPLAYAVWTLVQDKDELDIVARARSDPQARSDRPEHPPASMDRVEQRTGVGAEPDHRLPPPPVASPSPTV